MNNIVFHNIMMKMQKNIENDIADSVRRVKNDYECIGEKCVCYPLCCGKNPKGSLPQELWTDVHLSTCKPRKKCEWDLRGRFYEEVDEVWD